MPLVLDACALIALLRDEPGAAYVERVLSEEDCLIHGVNLCEVLYDVMRTDGEAKALEDYERVVHPGIDVSDDLDVPFITDAARFKAGGRISLADSFAAALARRLDAAVLTADRREFGPLADAGACRVDFFR